MKIINTLYLCLFQTFVTLTILGSGGRIVCGGVTMPLEDDVYARFGRRLSRSRKKAGLTQEKLAASIGISRASVANIERARQHVQLHKVYAIADALEIDITDLLPAVPKPKTPLPVDERHLEQFSVKESQFLKRIVLPRPSAKKKIK